MGLVHFVLRERVWFTCCVGAVVESSERTRDFICLWCPGFPDRYQFSQRGSPPLCADFVAKVVDGLAEQ